MEKKEFILYLLLVIVLLVPSITARAQEDSPGITLTLSKDMGYGGFGGDIQGTFSMKASGPDELVEVQFFIDDTLIGTDNEAPFRFQFYTSNFNPGIHSFRAVGILAGGSELQSNKFSRNFLSGESAAEGTITLVVTILAVVLGISLIGVVGPMLLRKKGKQRPIGEYSAAGGAICPRCQLPYSRHVLSPNIIVGKLERCPHCGKISVVRRASQENLVQAEKRLRADSQKGIIDFQQDEEESLRRALEESRFDD
jgi:hypothetical protein